MRCGLCLRARLQPAPVLVVLFAPQRVKKMASDFLGWILGSVLGNGGSGQQNPLGGGLGGLLGGILGGNNRPASGGLDDSGSLGGPGGMAGLGQGELACENFAKLRERYPNEAPKFNQRVVQEAQKAQCPAG